MSAPSFASNLVSKSCCTALTAEHNDCDWIENTAGFVSGAHRDAWWPTVNLGEVLPFGFGSSTYVNSHYQGFPDRDSALLGACWDCTIVILSLVALFASLT